MNETVNGQTANDGIFKVCGTRYTSSAVCYKCGPHQYNGCTALNAVHVLYADLMCRKSGLEIVIYRLRTRGSDSTDEQMKCKSLYNPSHQLSSASATGVVPPSEDNICSVNRENSRCSMKPTTRYVIEKSSPAPATNRTNRVHVDTPRSF